MSELPTDAGAPSTNKFPIALDKGGTLQALPQNIVMWSVLQPFIDQSGTITSESPLMSSSSVCHNNSVISTLFGMGHGLLGVPESILAAC